MNHDVEHITTTGRALRFSLVIPTHNRRESLRRCLETAVTQDYAEYEVLVVDDGSSDGTEEMASEFAGVRYLRQVRNQGPASARNRGIRESTGDVVAFTDDDCLLPRDFVRRLADGYADYAGVGGVGGYQEAAEQVLASNLLARLEAYHIHAELGAGDAPSVGGKECPASATNSMSYRRELLLALGGFDETFPYAAGEDTDLKWRAVDRGHRLLYVPVKVTHDRPYTWPDFWRQHVIRGRGVVHFEKKHMGHPPTYVRVLMRFGKRLVRWLAALPRLGPALATARFASEWANALGQWRELRRLGRDRKRATADTSG